MRVTLLFPYSGQEYREQGRHRNKRAVFPALGELTQMMEPTVNQEEMREIPQM